MGISMNVITLIGMGIIGIGLISMSTRIIGIGMGTLRINNRYRYDNLYSELIGIGISKIIGMQK